MSVRHGLRIADYGRMVNGGSGGVVAIGPPGVGVSIVGVKAGTVGAKV